MTNDARSVPGGCFSRLVMALVLMTALLTIAATVLLLMAILPLPDNLRPWAGLGIFLLTGATATFAILHRARSGEDVIRQQMTRLFGPLGLSLQQNGKQAGTYAGEYRGYELRADYSITGTPQRPTYHLEIALHAPASFRLAIGMMKFRLQFDETAFGESWPLNNPDYDGLAVFTDDPDAARALLTSPQAKIALLDLLAPDAPGVRNLILAENALLLRLRHHSFKRLNPPLIKQWVDDLIALLPGESASYP
jgi:hypothetical protein